MSNASSSSSSSSTTSGRRHHRFVSAFVVLVALLPAWCHSLTDNSNSSSSSEQSSLHYELSLSLAIGGAANTSAAANGTRTHEDEYFIATRYNHIVEFITFPFIFAIGTVCNILIFLVMRRKKMRHQSTYFYMAVLAIADEMVLINGCLNFWIFLYTGQAITIMSNVTCKLACIAFYASLHFSVWMVVIMTIERFIAVALPLQASRLCTVNKAKAATMSLAVVVLAINSHFVFTHSLIARVDINDTIAGCQSSSDAYDFFMEQIWPWIDASIYSFVPLSLLIIFNILIVHNLLKASKNMEKLNNKKASIHLLKKQQQKEQQQQQQLSVNNNNGPASEIDADVVSSYSRNEQPSGGGGGECFDNMLCQSSSSSSRRRQTQQDQAANFKPKTLSTSSSMNMAPPSVAERSRLSSKEIELTHLSASQCLRSGLSSSSTQLNSQTSSSSNQAKCKSNAKGGAHSNATAANRRLTIMLLVVSMSFFLTSMPIVTLQTVEQTNFVNKTRVVLIVRGVFLTLQYLNHSINFFLYAVTGKTFRKEFFALFEPFKRRLCKQAKAKNHVYNPIYSSAAALNRKTNGVASRSEPPSAVCVVPKIRLNNDLLSTSDTNRQ